MTDLGPTDPRDVLALLDAHATGADGEDVLRAVLEGIVREDELVAASKRRRHLVSLTMPFATSPVYSRLGRLR